MVTTHDSEHTGQPVRHEEHPRAAVHRTILVVDVEGFGDRRRTTPHRLAVREGMYRALRQAFGDVGVPWADCHHEDRGDGVFILAPAQIPKGPFVESLPHALVAAVRQHNITHRAEERVRLRMALHAGEVAYDEHGVTAASINLAFRLLDARPLKAALAESPGVLALITSEWFFDEVVRHSQDTDPATYRPVRVAVKETTTVGWICLPDHPYPSDTTHLTAAPTDPVMPVPRQLPAVPALFVGRRQELADLNRVLDTQVASGGTVVISAIGGAGGIGKTALALVWAHQNLDRFPDGQLHVNLRGFDRSGQHMPPAVALRCFLDALGVDSATIPVDLDAQTGLYRSLVAGKRMLIVLDNARDTTQVEPLLPGDPTCTVLITSRHRLAGLAVRGAYLLDLDVLTDIEARELLARHLGPERLAAAPDAVEELLSWCAGLPLALGIVAAHAKAHPQFPLAVLVAELRDASSRLDALDAGGDLAVNLRAVLSWSYYALTPETAGVFRLLGQAPGPDIGLPAVASLIGLPKVRVRGMLRELETAYLIRQHRPGRYRMHDLIRLYAVDRADHDHSPDGGEAALRRLVDFYLHTAHTAATLLSPHRRPIPLDGPAPGCVPQPLDDEAAAIAWFDTEHPGLLAIQRLAAQQGWHLAVWQLAWTLTSFRYRRGHLHDQIAAWQAGLTAAEHLNQPATHVLAHRNLGHALFMLGRHEDALDHLRHALTHAEHTGDAYDQAATHHALAGAWALQGDDRQALIHATYALRLIQTLDLPTREADVLNGMGWSEARLGSYRQARKHCEAALRLHRHHRNRWGEAAALHNLGYTAHQSGRYRDALDHYRQAQALFRDFGDTYREANTLDCLGQVHAALSEHSQAHHAWRRVLELYQVQHRVEETERVQQQLNDLDAQLNDKPR